MKVLDNNNKFLDTAESQKMINSREIIDFSLLSPDYPINTYYITSSSSGCEFDLNSNNNINENSQDIVLTFLEKNNNNVNINAQCEFSKNNKNKIPCSLEQEINNNYILDSYIGSSENSIFNILSETNKDFQLNCKKSKKNLSTGAIVGIVLGVVGFIVIVISIIACCRKKKDEKEADNVNEEKQQEIKKIRYSTVNGISNRNSSKKIKVYDSALGTKTGKTKKKKKVKSKYKE